MSGYIGEVIVIPVIARNEAISELCKSSVLEFFS